MVTGGNGNITKQPITEKKNNSANLTIIDYKIKIIVVKNTNMLKLIQKFLMHQDY